MIIVSCIFLLITIIILITTQTLWWHPKPHNDILHKDFSTHKDLWIKKSGNKNLLIMLHGMYSCPNIFEEAANHFVNSGWDVFAPVLPNASTTPSELSNQQSYQWEDSIKVAFHRSLIYNQGYEKIALGGHSQGGSIALTIAPSLPFLSGLIIVASPLNLIHKKTSFWRKIGLIFSGLLYFLVPKKGLFLKIKNSEEKSLVEGGNHHPKEFFFSLTLHSMKLGLKKTCKFLSRIQTPSLLIYEKGDRTTNFDDTKILTKNIPNSTLCTLNTPLSLDPFSGRHKLFSYIHTKNQVIEEIDSFLKQISSN